MAESTKVLIVGAGPTGLVLALWLTRLGVKVRIIDKTKEPGTTSRALVVHARTFEFYQQLGLADEVLAKGLKFAALNLWVKGRKAGHIQLGDIGKGLSPFPYLVIFPQDEHERLLIEHLQKAGVTVERETELLNFSQSEVVTAELKGPDGNIEIYQTDYLAGCDGARSTVRETLGAEFSGTTYSHMFYVADVKATGPLIDKELHIGLDRADLLFAFPLKGDQQARLIGTIKENIDKKSPGQPPKDLTWNDVSDFSLHELKVKVQELHWFSTYHVHHRVADHFHFGRVFLLGDAGHIHSPVGGQGMNTGIGDAVNLAWKLAAVLKGNADSKILYTYETERIAFARRLVATTDRAFTLVTSEGPLAQLIRMQVVPRLIPRLLRPQFMRRLMFRTVSQIEIQYRASALSAGRAGRLCGGDRLPWTGDNFSVLSSLQWQVHIYGVASDHFKRTCTELGLALHVFPWQRSFAKMGFAENAFYLVRPDGYIAFANRNQVAESLNTHLQTFQISIR